MEFNATFIVSAISFIVFTIIMNAIFYKPLQKIVSKRQKFIDDSLEEAKNNNVKSETILKDKEKKLEKSRHEAKKIILNKSDEVKIQKTQLASDARQKADSKIKTKKDELQKSCEDAQVVLEKESQNLAELIAKKLLKG